MHLSLKKSSSLLVSLFLLVLVLAGCTQSPASQATTAEGEAAAEANANAQAQNAGGKTAYPLTIENFALSGEGGTWQAKTQTFEKAPEKVVANTQPAAELLIKLGLTDKIVGVAAVYGDVAPDMADEFAKIPVLSNDYVGKEIVVGANPDLVFGRGDLFADADWGVGTVDGLNDLGINTFVQNTSVKGATLDDLFKDIEQLGQIFDVQDKANEFAVGLQARVEAIKAIASAAEKPLRFAYISSSSKDSVSVYSGSNDTFQSDALGLLKLENSFGDVSGEISVEQFVSTNPDILLISYYKGGPDIEEAVKNIYANPALQSMSAIQNKKIYVIDFNQFWGYGYQIFDGVEKLGTEIY